MQYEEEGNSEELQASGQRRAAKETIAVISCSVTNHPQTWQPKSTFNMSKILWVRNLGAA